MIISSLAKSKQIIGAHFQKYFSTIFLFFEFLNIQIDLIILKTKDQQFTLTTKKSLHIIFKSCQRLYGILNLSNCQPHIPRRCNR